MKNDNIADLVEPLTATAYQFEKLLWRMMPKSLQPMPEVNLIRAIFGSAWDEAEMQSARKFFLDAISPMERYCEACGLDVDQIRALFKKHNTGYRDFMDLITDAPGDAE